MKGFLLTVLLMAGVGSCIFVTYEPPSPTKDPKTIRQEYAEKNLPEGCSIRALPKYGGVDHVIMVDCSGRSVVTTGFRWKEPYTGLCGKVPCTMYHDKSGALIRID